MGYKPAEALKERIAPTEKRDGKWLVGEVHDPRSALLGGVAGHAGLFATADDLAVYAQMLLDGGVWKDRRILSALTVKRLTTPHPVPLGRRRPRPTHLRLGRADAVLRQPRRAVRRRVPASATPASPARRSGSTRTSRDGRDPADQPRPSRRQGRHPPAVEPDRHIAAAALEPSPPEAKPVMTGLDVLERDDFAALKGRHVGLVTNHTGVDRDGRSAIDLLSKADGVTLVALFSPEHGIRGAVDEKVDDSKDEKTGLPIYSLYGSRKKPTAETLKGIDTLVLRHPGCRMPLLHLRKHAGRRAGGGGGEQDRGDGAGPAEPAGRRGGRRPGSGRRPRVVRRLSHAAGAARPDDGRVGPAVQRGAQNRRRPGGDPDGELAPRRPLRRIRVCAGSTRRRTCARRWRRCFTPASACWRRRT